MASNLPAVQSLAANTNYNTGTSNSMAPQIGAGQSNGSLFNLQSAHEYSNDIMAQNLNTGCTGFSQQNPSVFPQSGYNVQTQPPEQTAYQQPTSPAQPAPAFNGNQYSQQDMAQYYNVLNQKTQNQQEPQASNTGKKAGFILGALAPVATGLYKLAKGGALKDVFKIKSLAIKVPALAVAGWAIGALIDGVTKPNPEAQAQEVQAQAQAQVPMQYQQQIQA